MGLTLSFPVKVVEPGAVVETPFDTTVNAPSKETDPTISVALNDATTAALVAPIAAAVVVAITPLLPATAPSAPLTPAQLAAQYSKNTLLQAALLSTT